MRHVCNSTAFNPFLRCFWLTYLSLDILGSVRGRLLPLSWLSATQSSCWAFRYDVKPRAKFSYFVNSLSQFRKDCMSRIVVFITRTVSFSLSMSTVSSLLVSTVLVVMIDLSQYINMLADSNTGSGLLLFLNISPLCRIFTIRCLKHTMFFGICYSCSVFTVRSKFNISIVKYVLYFCIIIIIIGSSSSSSSSSSVGRVAQSV